MTKSLSTLALLLALAQCAQGSSPGAHEPDARSERAAVATQVSPEERSQIQDTLEKYVRATRSYDVDLLKQITTSEFFDKMDFAKKTQALRAQGVAPQAVPALKSIDVVSRSPEGVYARYEVEGKGATDSDNWFLLNKGSGTWKIEAFVDHFDPRSSAH